MAGKVNRHTIFSIWLLLKSGADDSAYVKGRPKEELNITNWFTIFNKI